MQKRASAPWATGLQVNSLDSMIATGNYWRIIEMMLRNTRCRSRIKCLKDSGPTDWTHFFLVPVDGYIEGRCGPVPVKEVDWVEVDPLEVQDIGRLVPQRLVDHTTELMSQLTQHGIKFQQVEHVFRIYPNAA